MEIPLKDKSPVTQKESYIKIIREWLIEDVLTHKINFNEFGLLQWFFVKADPFTGVVLTNFSHIALELDGLTPDAVRYIAEKLKSKEYVYYKMTQGQKGFTKFYLNRFPLPNNKLTNLSKIISEEVSDVNNLIPKSENSSTSEKSYS